MARRGARRSATSLIEMLVVIAIIGILITMLLPSLQRSMQMASDTVCKQNLRSLSLAMQSYRLEYDGWLPTKNVEQPSPLASGGAQTPDVWFLKLYPHYLEDLGALSCPEDPFRYRMTQARNVATNPAVADYPSYGMNSFIVHGAGGHLADLDRNNPSRPLDTILVADMGPDVLSGSPEMPPKGSAAYLRGPKRNNSMLTWDDGYEALSREMKEPWLTTRHGRGINVVTLGGAVRTARTDDVMRREIRWRYDDCYAGGCTLCALGPRDLIYHYSFAADHLYWWTGPIRVNNGRP